MLVERYLNLVKESLLNGLYIELEAQLLFSVLCAAHETVVDLPEFWKVRKDKALIGALVEAKNQGDTVILETDIAGGKKLADYSLRNYTEFALTLVGRRRLDHLQSCVESILEEGIPGDLLEAGVWRGGCCILMRAILAARHCSDRKVWLCDSFAGLPQSTLKQDLTFEMGADRLPFLAISEDQVRENFSRFDLLDDQVKFVPGWFKDSLLDTSIEQLALLRIDVDLFESTLEVLTHLYPKVSDGGWVIVDDYRILPPCRLAVDQYRSEHNIRDSDSLHRRACCLLASGR